MNKEIKAKPVEKTPRFPLKRAQLTKQYDTQITHDEPFSQPPHNSVKSLALVYTHCEPPSFWFWCTDYFIAGSFQTH